MRRRLILVSIFCLFASCLASHSARAEFIDEDEALPNQMDQPSAVYSVSPKNGFTSGGTAIRITGSNLFPSMIIRLGGSICSDVKLVGRNVLQCKSPRHPPGVVGMIIQKPHELLKNDKVFTYVPDLFLSPYNLGVAFGEKSHFTATGGIPPYTFTVLQGSAQLDSASGVIQAPSNYDVGVVRVTDSMGNTSETPYRVLPKLKVSPESADIFTNNYLSISGWGGEPPYELTLASGEGRLFPDRRVYLAGSNPGTATVRLTDEIHNSVDLQITIHQPPRLAGKLVAAGDEDTCAIQNGSVSCWGANRIQKKLTSKVIVTDKAVANPQLTKGVTSIVSGAHHKCVLRGDQVLCWGSNQYGQLGNGSTQNSPTPVPVIGLESGVLSITAGSFHTCAALDGSVVCWGRNESGQLGNGTTEQNPFPSGVLNIRGKITGVAGGATHTCAIVGGSAYCWGKNESGQLGSGDKIDSTRPVKVTGLGSDVALISAGRSSSCAAGPGYLKCWGFDGTGDKAGEASKVRMKNADTGSNIPTIATPNTTIDPSVPHSIPIPGDVTVLSSQQYHSCAIVNAAVYCWGYNYQGQVGDTSVDNEWTQPTRVADLSGKVLDVSTGDSHTCAALEGGEIYCWGDNSFGELGDGETHRQLKPVLVIKETPKKSGR